MVCIEFYLIMNVGVGSTNGWFPDGQGKKPWLNHAKSMFSDSIFKFFLLFCFFLTFSLPPCNQAQPAIS